MIILLKKGRIDGGVWGYIGTTISLPRDLITKPQRQLQARFSYT